MSVDAHRDDTGARMGMWLFLFSELLLFGGLFVLYAVTLSTHGEAFAAAGRELNWVLGTINTLVLLTSSLTAAIALSAVQKGNSALALRCLWGTLALALCFLVIKYVEWSSKIHHGLYPGGAQLAERPEGQMAFFNLYYVTTGLHGLHVLIGGALLGWVVLKIRQGGVHRSNFVLLENSVLYWHLVDLIWIFIFPLYYLML